MLESIFKFLDGFVSFPYYFVLDVSAWGQVSFQTPATPTMYGITNLHHDIFTVLVLIGSIIVYLTKKIIELYTSSKKNIYWPVIRRNFKFVKHTKLEIAWTVLPIVTLLIIIIPSFSLLYSMDEVFGSDITLKVVGRQWYWTYEINMMVDNRNDSIHGPEFDSYMIAESDLLPGSFRLLEVDNRVLLPVYNHVRVIVTSTDVLHSWAIPSAGVKMDACPGRLNQLDLFLSRRGIFYGQCSELCGINHGFMPIVIQGVRFSKFVNWLCEEATASEMKKRLTKGTELLHAHIKAGKASFSMYATPSKEWIWSWNATKFRW